MKKILVICICTLLPNNIFARGGGHGGGHSSSSSHSSFSGSHASSESSSFHNLMLYRAVTSSLSNTSAGNTSNCSESPKWYEFTKKRCTNNN